MEKSFEFGNYEPDGLFVGPKWWGGRFSSHFENWLYAFGLAIRYLMINFGLTWAPTVSEQLYSNTRRKWCVLRIFLKLDILQAFRLDVEIPIFILPQDSRSELERKTDDKS